MIIANSIAERSAAKALAWRLRADGKWEGAETPAELAAITPAPAPESLPDISPRQIRQALTDAGKRAAVEAGVAASSQHVKDWWEFATVFERGHPMIAAMLPALGITNAQADAIWLAASQL